MNRVDLLTCDLYQGSRFERSIRGLSGVAVRVLASNLCGRQVESQAGRFMLEVGSYLLMPGGLQCSMHWFPPPVQLPIAI